LGSSQDGQVIITTNHNELPTTFNEMEVSPRDLGNKHLPPDLTLNVPNRSPDNTTRPRGFRRKNSVAPTWIGVVKLVGMAMNNLHAPHQTPSR